MAPIAPLLAFALAMAPPPAPRFEKTTLDPAFRAEGAAFGDVDRDGDKDVLVGDFWYEAPEWNRHEIRKPGDLKDGFASYSEAMTVWSDDVNKDGWVDQISIGFPGKPAYWQENPKGKEGHWVERVAWPSACNETPLYMDLFGEGRRVLVIATQPKGQGRMGEMAWFEPASDPSAPWTMHSISGPSSEGKEVPGTQQFAHGLGTGDLNGDGRLDLICTGGWWEGPSTPSHQGPWAFHPLNLGVASADIHVADVNGDGKRDLIASSAHQFGIWAFLQGEPKEGHPTFAKTDLFPKLVSETHALHYVDMDRDGVKDLVTGKRWWSHGKNEPGSDMPSRLYVFKGSKTAAGGLEFLPIAIDEDSGVGTQFTVEDHEGDGDLDLVIANKRGVFLFRQAGP